MSSDPIVVNQGAIQRVVATVEITKESIQNIDGSDLKGTNKFIDNTFKNSTNATITLPSVAGTLALMSDVQSGTMTMTNKTLTSPVISSISNSNATITVPSTTGTLALLSDVESGTMTMTNKTLTSPVISTISNSSATITVPSTTGTLALLSDVESGTMTMTNKTLTAPVISTITNGNATITLPSTTGTLALLADVQGADTTITNNINTLQQEINYLVVRLEATLQYLRRWINAGNLAMADIITKVDAAVDAYAASNDDNDEGEPEGNGE